MLILMLMLMLMLMRRLGYANWAIRCRLIGISLVLCLMFHPRFELISTDIDLIDLMICIFFK